MTEIKHQPSLELQRLEELENSLKSIQTRIQYLVKEQGKTQKNVQKTLKSSIAKIGHKANQARFYEEMRSLHEKQNANRSVMHSSIMEYKEKQKQDISAIKENILEMKRAQSSTLKQISRKNQQVIRDSKRKQAESKKNTIDQIRFLRNQTKKQLCRKKEEQEKQHQRKKEEMIAERLKERSVLENKIAELESLESKLILKIQESQKTARTIRDVANQSGRIPKEEFCKILKEVRKQKGRHAKDQDINQAVFDKFMMTKTSQSSVSTNRLSNSRLLTEQSPKIIH